MWRRGREVEKGGRKRAGAQLKQKRPGVLACWVAAGEFREREREKGRKRERERDRERKREREQRESEKIERERER